MYISHAQFALDLQELHLCDSEVRTNESQRAKRGRKENAQRERIGATKCAGQVTRVPK
jgi:hypothetical protein